MNKNKCIWDNINIDDDIFNEICKYIYYPQNIILLEDLRSYIFVKKKIISYFNFNIVIWYLILECENNLNIEEKKIYYNTLNFPNKIYGNNVSWTLKWYNFYSKIISNYLLKMKPIQRHSFLTNLS